MEDTRTNNQTCCVSCVTQEKTRTNNEIDYDGVAKPTPSLSDKKRKKGGDADFNSLPDELVGEVLSFNSTLCLLEYKTVSRKWYNMISQNLFRKSHHPNQQTELWFEGIYPYPRDSGWLVLDFDQSRYNSCFDSIHIEDLASRILMLDTRHVLSNLLGYCVPLALYEKEDRIEVHNMITGECTELDFGFKSSGSYGIGVVGGQAEVFGVILTAGFVMTLDNKTLKPLHGDLPQPDQLWNAGAFVDAKLYAICVKTDNICYFDFETERFGWVNPPPQLFLHDTETVLGVLDNGLSLSAHGTHNSELWVYKSNTWSFIMRLQDPCRPIIRIRDLLLVDNMYHGIQVLDFDGQVQRRLKSRNMYAAEFKGSGVIVKRLLNKRLLNN